MDSFHRYIVGPFDMVLCFLIYAAVGFMAVACVGIPFCLLFFVDPVGVTIIIAIFVALLSATAPKK